VLVAAIDKYQFAWGLTWISSSGVSAKALAKERLDPAKKWVYSAIESPDGGMVLGYAEAPEGRAQKLYSYAGALAGVAGDGIYVAPAGDDDLWFAVIVGGSVVIDTDAILPTAEAVARIVGFGRAFAYPVLLAEGFDLPIEHSGTFDPDCVIHSPTLSPMVRTGGGETAGKVAILLVMLSALGGGWYWHQSSSEFAGDDPAAAEAQAMRDAYFQSIQGELAAVPQHAGWAAAAVELADSTFPLARGGWHLQGVVCSPVRCDARYEKGADGTPSSVSHLAQGLGSAAVSVSEDMREVVASFPLTVPTGLSWDDSMIEAGYVAGAPLADVVGPLPLRISNVSLAAPPMRENLTQMFSAPPEFAPLYRESVRLQSPEQANGRKIRYLAARMAEAGFAPTRAAYTIGSSSSAAWSIDFGRITGAAL